MTKYNSKITTCKAGHNHDSKKEAERCDELNLLEKGKVIEGLEQQPKFNLLCDFMYKGEKIKGVDYIADFMYYDKEKKIGIIEDTKGFKTEVYKLKRKMLLSIIKAKSNFLFVEG